MTTTLTPDWTLDEASFRYLLGPLFDADTTEVVWRIFEEAAAEWNGHVDMYAADPSDEEISEDPELANVAAFTELYQQTIDALPPEELLSLFEREIKLFVDSCSEASKYMRMIVDRQPQLAESVAELCALLTGEIERVFSGRAGS